MHISAIISEYNPFHNGHMHHINETRKLGATHIVCVMSGNFVQRGECAIFEKQSRAEMALLGGADLVLELPCVWSMASAEKFAFAGVYIINALGCADSISFGSESGSITALQRACDAVISEKIKARLHFYLDAGMTFAMARQNAVVEAFGADIAALLSCPNNILGIEYLKALRALESTVAPITIARHGCGHDAHASNGDYASASRIRELISAGSHDFYRMIPASTANVIKRELKRSSAPASIQNIERAILAKLRTMKIEELAALPDVTEGLENRIHAAIRNANSLDELHGQIKTKRYSLARIRRIVLCAFLGITRDLVQAAVPYVRVLGFNDRGKEILAKAKASASIPVITRASEIKALDERARKIFAAECTATDIYQLCKPNVDVCGLEMTRKIIKV